MKSINRNDFIEIGSVVKTHGTKGELRLELFRNYKFNEWAFLEIQGKPVPFLVESSFGSVDAPIIKLMDVNTPDAASKLVGNLILMLGKPTKAKKKDLNQSIIGYMIVDEILGEIGPVEELMELPQQLLLQTHYQGKEVLIPAVEAIIVDIDDDKKKVTVSLPEGLLLM